MTKPVVLQGAQFGSNNPSTARLYPKGRYGISMPQLRNVMTRYAFTFMRRYIHFSENDKQKPKGEHKYDPLFKVNFALDAVQADLHASWVAGQHLVIDESMVKCLSFATS